VPSGPPIRLIIGWPAHFVDAFFGILRPKFLAAVPVTISRIDLSAPLGVRVPDLHTVSVSLQAFRVRWRLADFCDAAVSAATLHTWWPAILGNRRCSDSPLNSKGTQSSDV
jgi:hypothetical protein